MYTPDWSSFFDVSVLGARIQFLNRRVRQKRSTNAAGLGRGRPDGGEGLRLPAPSCERDRLIVGGGTWDRSGGRRNRAPDYRYDRDGGCGGDVYRRFFPAIFYVVEKFLGR